MDEKIIKATRRTLTGKQVKTLRRVGKTPAVLYGHKFAPIAIVLDTHEATLTLATVSASTIVTVDLDGEPYASLVREKQRDPVKRNLLHVDFQVISLTEKIRVAVRVEVHGHSPAVKDFNATIVTNLNEIEVQALPRDLPERIIVDISSLVNVGDAIFVRDLKFADSVEVLSDLDEIVVNATGAAAEEVEEVAVEALAEPEVIERGKKEDDDED